MIHGRFLWGIEWIKKSADQGLEDAKRLLQKINP